MENFEIINANKEQNAIIAEIFGTKEVCDENSRIRHSTTTDTKLLFNALSGKSDPVKKYLGETVDVIDIVITSADVNVDVNDAEKGKVNKPVIHFFTADGRHLSTLSNGIIRNVKDLLSCGLIPTKESPMRLRFDEVETPKGTAHTFELI